MKDIADLLARIFLAIIFLYEAFDIIAFYDKNINTMTEYGITSFQDWLLMPTIVTLILGGLMVLTGYYAGLGALLLLLYWLPFTLIVHDFWNEPIDQQRLSSLTFMRNMAVAGGLLLLIANGAGKYSIKRLIHVMRLPK